MELKNLETIQITNLKSIKIFLASSSELEVDREQFEIFINRRNKDYIRKGIFLELVIWEDFLDAMAQTRLQDEYNKAIQYFSFNTFYFLGRAIGSLGNRGLGNFSQLVPKSPKPNLPIA